MDPSQEVPSGEGEGQPPAEPAQGSQIGGEIGAASPRAEAGAPAQPVRIESEGPGSAPPPRPEVPRYEAPRPAPVTPRAADNRPKRPWFLLVALITAWIFGAAGFLDGCTTMSFYQAETVDASSYVQRIHDEDEKKIVTASAQRLIDTMGHAKDRAFPLGVAAFLLGAAMIMLAARAMAGRSGARSPLIQVVVVQAALAVLTFVLTPDIRYARADLAVTNFAAQLRESGQDPKAVEDSLVVPGRLFRFFDGAWLGARSVVALLVLVALTRPRSRAFYDALEDRSPRR